MTSRQLASLDNPLKLVVFQSLHKWHWHNRSMLTLEPGKVKCRALTKFGLQPNRPTFGFDNFFDDYLR